MRPSLIPKTSCARAEPDPQELLYLHPKLELFADPLSFTS